MPGGFLVIGSIQPEQSATSAPYLIRLTPDGQPDRTFNFDGRVGIGTLGDALNVVALPSGQLLTGTRLNPYFQDYDENDDAAKINVELVKINP